MTDAPAPAGGLTARAIVAGLLLAVLLCGVNAYLTLSFGVIEEGPTIAALFFFAALYLSRNKITTTEMVIVATMGSAGGSFGFISNFFAAKVMATGEPYTFWQMTGFGLATSLIGMAFVVPLRELLVVRESLPWPGSRATHGVIHSLVEEGDPEQPRYLLVYGLAALAFVIGNDDDGYAWWPSASELPLFGLAAYGAAVAWSPFAIGGAYLMGMRTAVGFLVGGIVLLVMAPHLPTPAAPHRFVWPGIGFLVASGLTMMALSWRVMVDAMRSIVGRAGAASGAGVEGDDAAAAPEPPMLPGRQYPIFALVAMTVGIGLLVALFDLSLWLVVLLVVVGGFVQNVIATRAAAQTAFNPARVMGILLQGVTAAAGGAAAGTNLAGAGMVAGSGAQAGNLTGDMAYGRWFGIPARWQFWTQMLTIVPCALVGAWVFERIAATSSLQLEGGDLPAPVAKMWAASALVFDGSTPLPDEAPMAMAIAAGVAVVYVLLESRPAIAKWLPSSLGVGLGLVLPIAYDWAFFLGALVLWGVFERGLKVRTLTLTTCAVACIVAEGIGGILKPVLRLTGLLG
jgi:uncharacterized oligopeptide transporter (OPT) family protein